MTNEKSLCKPIPTKEFFVNLMTVMAFILSVLWICSHWKSLKYRLVSQGRHHDICDKTKDSFCVAIQHVPTWNSSGALSEFHLAFHLALPHKASQTRRS